MRRSASFVARIVNGAFPAIVAARLADLCVDCRRLDDPVDQSDRVRLVAMDQAAGEHQFLDAARSDQIAKPRVIGGRQAVAQRSRDGHAESRFRRADPQIARDRDDAAAAGGNALDLRDRRGAHALEPIDHRVEPRFVADDVVPRGEACKLTDVGARHERFAARAAEHEHPHVRIGVDPIAGLHQRLIHLPGHGVSGFGAVEGEHRDRTVDVEQHARGGHVRAPESRTAGARAELALEGVRVLDVTQVMAGPFCAMQLCDMGADVIKVEPPEGDSTRRMAGRAGDDSPSFNAVNRGKRGIVLDLKRASAQAAFRRLARRADVIIENYRPGVMRRFGLDYEALSRDHPGLIYASISGYGQTGPSASKGGFDLVAQGVSGLMSITGEPGGPPVKAGYR